MVYGLPVFFEILIWVAASFGLGLLWHRFVPAVGFFAGCALGPIGVMAATTPQTRGSRPAIFIGGTIGTLFYIYQLGWW